MRYYRYSSNRTRTVVRHVLKFLYIEVNSAFWWGEWVMRHILCHVTAIDQSASTTDQSNPNITARSKIHIYGNETALVKFC